MSSFCKCKSYSHFFSKNISVYAIFDQNVNDMLTNDIVSFEQLGPEFFLSENSLFWVVEFSVYLNRHVFVMFYKVLSFIAPGKVLLYQPKSKEIFLFLNENIHSVC